MLFHISGVHMKSFFSATLAACAAFALPVHAQDFPMRPVTLIVSFAPGGLTDIPARILAPEMQQRLRQSVIVENKAGASGITGGSYVVRSEPDGYIMLVSALSEGSAKLPRRNDICPSALQRHRARCRRCRERRCGCVFCILPEREGTDRWRATAGTRCHECNTPEHNAQHANHA